jgi:hypothetical protein
MNGPMTGACGTSERAESLLPSRLLPEYVQIKIHKSSVVPFSISACETVSGITGRTQTKCTQNRLTKKIFGARKRM